MKVFLQDKEGVDHELNYNDFYKTQFYQKLSDEEKKQNYLEKFFEAVYDGMNVEKGELQTSHLDIGVPIDLPTNIVTKFIQFQTDKLSQYLCRSKINKKYIKANSNAAVLTDLFLNTLVKGKNLVIKGFAFGQNPINGELYISLTCGTGGTAKIFDSMINGIQNGALSKYKYIKLDSVENPDTIRFYTKLGFRKPDKDTEKIIKDMYNTSAKSFDEYVKGTKKIVGGPMYLFPINADGEKMLKKKKCNHIYSPEEWFNELKKFKEDGKSVEEFIEQNKKDKLEGTGIGDWFRKKFEQVKNVFKPNLDGFNNTSNKTIMAYGDNVITELEIMRTPLSQMLHKIFNLITFNKWDEIRKKYGYDKLFHLALIATVKVNGVDKKVIMEKNEVVNINTNINIEPNSEIFKVALQGKSLKINDLLDNARNSVGNNTFFDYDAFSNNCQFFIKYLLQYSGLLTPQAEAFIFQDLKEVIKELPSYVSPITKGVTTLGAIVNKLRGKGNKDYTLHAVIFRKPYDIDNAKTKAKEFIKGKKDFYRETQTSYRFRNIPKQKFIKGSFRSKRIDPNITLVFGELK